LGSVFVLISINQYQKNGYNKETAFKTPMFCVQKNQLLYQKIQKGGGKKVRIEKILSLVQKTHRAQRRQKIAL